MTDSKKSKPAGAWRPALLLVLMALCLGAAGWKAVALHVLQRDFLQEEGDARTVRTVPLVANRGLITDRNGEPLAMSTPVKSLWTDPSEINPGDQKIAELARLLELDAQALRTRLEQNRNRRFLYLKRHLAPSEAEQVLALDIAGVYEQREYRRFYPHGEVAAHLIGFNDVDDNGQEGMERAYNDWLQGVPGSRRVIKDRRGNIIEELNTIELAQPGQDLQLSIDLRLQNLAYRELKAEYLKRNAKSASVVVLDVATGEVLAVANQPSYNPHNKSLIEDLSVTRNRAFTDIYEPGSTMKPFTIAAALESGRYTPDTVIETGNGWMIVAGRTVQDLFGYGALTTTGVITKSSNVGISKIAADIGAGPIVDVLERFGFGRAPGTGFPGEQAGVVPNPGRLGQHATAVLSFGYGLSATAVHLAQAYSILADEGVRKPVSLLKLSEDEIAELPRDRVISPIIARQVVEMLETVVDRSRGGAVTAARIPFYHVAGKTGTSHVVGASGYEENLHNSLFVGLAPATRPEIIVVVIVNEPKGDEHFGGQVAAPVFSRVAAGAMRILNVPPDNVPESALARSPAADLPPDAEPRPQIQGQTGNEGVPEL